MSEQILIAKKTQVAPGCGCRIRAGEYFLQESDGTSWCWKCAELPERPGGGALQMIEDDYCPD